MTDLEFQLFKGAAVLGSLVLVTSMQCLVPYKRGWRDVLRNWRTNVPLAAGNVLLFAIVCGGCACAVAKAVEVRGFGIMMALGWSEGLRIVVSVFVLDLVAYAWHRANHLTPLLWRFHSVHHSDQVFDVSTAFRFHPGEILLALGVRLAVVAALGIPVLGVLAFEMLYAFANQFEHGNIRLPKRVERSIGFLFVTPALHRKHHSIVSLEMNQNFSTIFSIWDRLLGTFAPSAPSEEIDVGLAGMASDPFNPFSLLRMPFGPRDS